jgi:hypothetical protein
MTTFKLTEKDLLTNVDRTTDSILIHDDSATALKRTTIDNALNLTSQPVGVDDTQTLTNKTLTAPAINSPVLGGTVSGTYTLGGTPTLHASIVSLTGVQTLTNKTLTAPTINNATISNPTLTADAISEHTADNGVTVDGLNIKDGKLNTADSVPTVALEDGAVTPAKTTFSGCRVYGSTNQLNLVNGVYTVVQFDTVDYDTDGCFNTGTYTYTVPASGYYRFYYYVEFIHGTADKRFVVRLKKNTSTYVSYAIVHSSMTDTVSVRGVDVSHFDAGDAITISAKSAIGANTCDINHAIDASSFTIEQVSVDV